MQGPARQLNAASRFTGTAPGAWQRRNAGQPSLSMGRTVSSSPITMLSAQHWLVYRIQPIMMLSAQRNSPREVAAWPLICFGSPEGYTPAASGPHASPVPCKFPDNMQGPLVPAGVRWTSRARCAADKSAAGKAATSRRSPKRLRRDCLRQSLHHAAVTTVHLHRPEVCSDSFAPAVAKMRPPSACTRSMAPYQREPSISMQQKSGAQVNASRWQPGGAEKRP